MIRTRHTNSKGEFDGDDIDKCDSVVSSSVPRTTAPPTCTPSAGRVDETAPVATLPIVAIKSRPAATLVALILFTLTLIMIVLRCDMWRAQPPRIQSWGVIATHASNFVAVLVERELARHGFDVTVLASPPADYPLDVYLLLNPHEFATVPMPPASKLIVFRASSVSRLDPLFFTPDYIRLLQRSRAVLEHELVIIEATRAVLGGAIPISHVPVGASAMPLSAADGYAKVTHPRQSTLSKSPLSVRMRGDVRVRDVVVSGDYVSNPRRARFLAAMKQSLTVMVVPTAALADAIAHARVYVIIRETVHDWLDYPLIQV